MNTFQLECFLAVANTLSFARAAEQMQVSQPTITHQIKSLEDELNTKLFHRSTRLVEVTEDGKAFMSDAKSIIAIEAQAKMRLRSSSEKPIERISIGCSNYIQLAMISEILKMQKNEVPNLHPQLYVLPHEQLFQQLSTERIDIIFGIYDHTAFKGDIKYKELLQSNIVCVCRNDNHLAEKTNLELKELSEEALIFCDPMSLTPEMAKLQYSLAEDRELSSIHFCSSSVASYVLARSGFGVALLPNLLIPKDPDIVKIPLADAPKLSFGLFYKPSVGDSLIRQFVSLAKEQFEQKNSFEED